MAEEEKRVIKEKDRVEDWIWEGTYVASFSCHPLEVDSFISRFKRRSGEEGKEVVDSYVTEESMFAKVEFLVRPKIKNDLKLKDVINKINSDNTHKEID